VDPIAIGLIVFAFVISGALFGVFLRPRLPVAHLCKDSKEIMKLGTGLVATMTALILGLMTASAKSSFDMRDQAVKHAAADLLTFDRILARYGPETREIRDSLRRLVAWRHDVIWRSHQRSAAFQPGYPADPAETTPILEGIGDQIQALTPQNDSQRWLQSRALNSIEEILKSRWGTFGDGRLTIPVPFLIALIFWLTIIFTIFGIFAPRNGTVLGILFVCALSVSCAVYLIVELDDPFDGVIMVSDEPIRYALSHMDQ